MKDRVKQIMESMHMTQQVFAQFIEMSPASLSSIFNGRTRPTLNIVEAIKKKIPDINTDWLMFGSGSMYVQQGSGMGAGLSFGVKPPVVSDGKFKGQFVVLEVVFPHIHMESVAADIVEGPACHLFLFCPAFSADIACRDQLLLDLYKIRFLLRDVQRG